MTSLLSVDGLTKVYRSRTRGDVRALDGVSFSVDRGQIVGLLGANGAGKTTAIKSICGLVRPTAGSIVVDGIDASIAPRRAAGRLAAVLEGNRTVYWRLSVVENLEFFASLRGIRASDAASRIDDLVALFRLEDKASTPAMKLSRGMQQKLAVACAVVGGTPLLLLDEPTLGLDVETSHELRGYLREIVQSGERTILLSSHDMRVVHDVCDRVVIINGGRVVADDAIRNLLELFKARVCRVTLQQPLPAPTLERLTATFELVRDTSNADRASVEVALRGGAEFYTLVDELRASDATIEAVDSIEPDLEEIFLSIVKGRAVP